MPPPHPQIHPRTPSSITLTHPLHHLSAPEFSALHTHALAAQARAYCPYSAFPVGAALLTESGAYVAGANVENASYPVGTCAERVMLGKAVVDGVITGGGGKGGAGGAGGAGQRVRAVAVVTGGEGPASPCGMCRQFIREFCELDMPIIMFDKDGNFAVMKLEELLPMSFGPEALGVPDPAKLAQAAQK